MSPNTKQLHIKLRRINFKYYLRSIIKNFLWLVSSVCVSLLVILLTESVYYLSSDLKTIILLVLLLTTTLFTIVGIILPFLKAFGVLSGLNVYTINSIIQNKYPELKDYVLNIIELENEYNDSSSVLIEASINQKLEVINTVDIARSVDFKHLYKVYTQSMLILFGVFLVIVFNFSRTTEALTRLGNYRVDYFPPAPFSVTIDSAQLSIEKGEDLTIDLCVKGKVIPDELFLKIGANYFLTLQRNDSLFSYTLKSVNSSFEFTITDKKFESKLYSVEVLKRPQILDLTTSVTAPSYTGVKNFVQKNNGNVDIPVGSNVKWQLKAVDTEDLSLIVNNDTIVVNKVDKVYLLDKYFKKNSRYYFLLSNSNFKQVRDVIYRVRVIPDIYPEIELKQLRDSSRFTTFFFKGEISDDYGFSKLNFCVKWDGGDSIVNLPFDSGLQMQKFYFAYDFSNYSQYTNSLEYYFEVWDNDQVNGVKKAISNVFKFNFPSKKDIIDQQDTDHNELETLAQKSKNIIDNIRKGIKSIQQKSVEKSMSSWERSQMLQNVMEQRNQLQEMMKQMQQKSEQMNDFSNSFEKQDQDLLEKQKEINDLMREIFSDEIQKLMEEFNDLLNKFDQKKFNDLSKKMDQTMDDFDKRMDRNLEMLRKLQIERKLNRIINELREMSRIENKMSDEKHNLRKDGANQLSNIKSHKEHFDLLMEELKKSNELNQKLENKLSLNFDESQKLIQKNFEQIEQDIDKKKQSGYKKSLKKNSEDLNDLSNKIQQSLEKDKAQKLEINLQALRFLLDDLVKMSYRQEDLYDRTQSLNNGDPLAVRVKADQKRIQTHFEIMRDSLYALAKRSVQIKNVINDDLVDIRYNLDKALDEMSEGRFYSARINGRHIITATNNISLFIEEVVKMLEKQKASSMKGNQNCEKPSDKPSSMPTLKDAQNSFKQQLQEMIDQMKQQGKGGKMNRQLGQALSQQEVMQNMIRKMLQNGEVGSEARETLKQIDRMLEQNKTDLLRYNLNNQLVRRQNTIFEKLLKAERSEMEREIDHERKSSNVDEYRLSNPAELFEGDKQKDDKQQYDGKSRVQFKEFYKKKVYEYQQNLNKK